MATVNRISKDDFKRTIAQSKMLEQNKNVAYLYFVEGLSQPEIMKQTGYDRRNLSRIIVQARGYLSALDDNASAWVRVELDMPKPIADAWSDLSADLAKCPQKISRPIIESVFNAIQKGGKSLKPARKLT